MQWVFFFLAVLLNWWCLTVISLWQEYCSNTYNIVSLWKSLNGWCAICIMPVFGSVVVDLQLVITFIKIIILCVYKMVFMPLVCACVWIVSMCEDDITISAIMKRKVASCEIKPVIPGQDLKHCPVCFMTWSCKSWVARVEQMGREQKLWSFVVSRWPDKKSFVFGGTEYISCFGRMWASDCEPFSTWCTPIKVYPDWRALAEPGNREVAEKQNYIVSPLKYILVVERLFMQRKKQNLIAKSLKYWLNKRLSC